jgi:hypothetical protein
VSTTLASVRTELAQRLGDASHVIWPEADLDDYIKEGYNLLVKETGCLWATDVLPDYGTAMTHTGNGGWELDYFPADFMVGECCQFTSLFERDYLDNAFGPASHTQHWEQNGDYVLTDYVSGVVDLPEDVLQIERATWNTKRITPLRSSDVEFDDRRYELNTGIVEGYMQDKDGLGKFRKYRVPSSPYDPYDVDADSTTGILITVSDLTSDTPLFEWGDLVQIPNQHAFGDPWGVIVGVYTEPLAVRIEYQRRGAELGDDQDFEIPDRYVMYVRHWAQYRCLEREGKGQELELAAHFKSRFEEGVARMLKRKAAMGYQKVQVLGGGGRTIIRKDRRARLPWQYGTVVR